MVPDQFIHDELSAQTNLCFSFFVSYRRGCNQGLPDVKTESQVSHFKIPNFLFTRQLQNYTGPVSCFFLFFLFFGRAAFLDSGYSSPELLIESSRGL